MAKRIMSCDRIRTADSKTCKEIYPAEVSRRSAEFSEVLSEYDKAVNRNFQRVERFEDERSGEKSSKVQDYAEYSEWLARKRRKSAEIGNEEMPRANHELDCTTHFCITIIPLSTALASLKPKE